MKQGYRNRGFSLTELLIVVAIIAFLLAILLPSLQAIRQEAQSCVCKARLFEVGRSFSMFLSQPETLKRSRSNVVANGFGLTSFIDYLYSAAKNYPDHSPSKTYSGNNLFICPTVSQPITVGFDDENGDGFSDWKVLEAGPDSAVRTPENVSYGFNARLRRVSRASGTFYVALTANLDNWNGSLSKMPLMLDVDALKALKNGKPPHEIAPRQEPLLSSLYRITDEEAMPNGNFWFPQYRHSSQSANLAFIDGHVSSSTNLLNDPSIVWADAIWEGSEEASVMVDTIIPEDVLTPLEGH